MNAGVRVLFDNTRPLNLYLRGGYRKTYMSLPDAVDLYKRLDEPVPDLSIKELDALHSWILTDAQTFLEKSSAADMFRWNG